MYFSWIVKLHCQDITGIPQVINTFFNHSTPFVLIALSINIILIIYATSFWILFSSLYLEISKGISKFTFFSISTVIINKEFFCIFFFIYLKIVIYLTSFNHFIQKFIKISIFWLLHFSNCSYHAPYPFHHLDFYHSIRKRANSFLKESHFFSISTLSYGHKESLLSWHSFPLFYRGVLGIVGFSTKNFWQRTSL